MQMLSVIAMAAGTAVSAYSQVRAGKVAEATAEAQEKAAKIRAQQGISEGRESAWRMRRESRRRLAAMRAGMGASGVSISGSSLDFLGEAANRLELSVQDRFRQAAIGAGNDLYSGELSLWEGQQRRTASTLRAYGTLLEGVGKTYKMGVDTGVFQPQQANA